MTKTIAEIARHNAKRASIAMVGRVLRQRLAHRINATIGAAILKPTKTIAAIARRSAVTMKNVSLAIVYRWFLAKKEKSSAIVWQTMELRIVLTPIAKIHHRFVSTHSPGIRAVPKAAPIWENSVRSAGHAIKPKMNNMNANVPKDWSQTLMSVSTRIHPNTAESHKKR